MSLFVLPRQAPIQGGNSYPGARLHFYASGSSTTRQTTYSDSDRTAAHANPVVADANGVFPAIWLDPLLTYRVRLATSSEVLIYDLDPYPGTTFSQAQLGAVLYPRTAAEIAASVTPTNYAYPPGNVLRYGTNTTPGTTNMAAAFTAAFSQCAQGGADVLIPPATYLCTSALTLYSNTRIRAHGATVNFNTAAPNCIVVSAITNLDWEGGTFVSTLPAELQSCFVLQNGATNNRVIVDKIQDFRNKGMDINNASHHNTIQCFDVSGATGAAGGCGFSIFGAAPNDCMYNTILPSYVHDSRCGFTMNGGKYNRIIRPVAIDCTLIGLSMDGVVGDGSSGDGDGPKYCYVENPVMINACSAPFGGIYLGNGADWNTITGAYCLNNLGAGIRSSGGVGYECRGNTIVGAVCDNNAASGINLSSAPDTQLVGCITKNNTGYGVQLFISDNTQILGGRADDNTLAGLILQSLGCVANGFQSTGNGTYGIWTTFSGSGNATNKFVGCSASGNTTANYYFQAGGTARDCAGYVNEASGNAILLTGTNTVIVTHGLSYTPLPPDIQISPLSNTNSLAGHWHGSLTSTTFTIASNNTAGINITFAWHARQV